MPCVYMLNHNAKSHGFPVAFHLTQRHGFPWLFALLVGRARFELATNGLKVRCSTG